MIKNVTALLIFLSSTLFSQTDFSPLQTKVTAIGKNVVIVNNNDNIAIGTSGALMQAFDGVHKTIIAKVEVIKKEGSKMYLSLAPFSYIQQETLPSYHIAPKVGDVVILNFLYNRALALVPDADTYKTVIKSFTNFEWIHPDIFAAKLAKSYHPTPDKETIKEVCAEQNIGLLLIYAQEKGHFVDCNSFKTISKVSLPVAQSVTLPFYNRLEPAKGRLFGLFGGKGVKNYSNFYTDLLK